MSSLFQSFCEMLDGLPAAAVKKAVTTERRMLEEDTVTGREECVGEATSILTFCRFLESCNTDTLTVFPDFPLEHCAFYGKIIHKLVEAGELPRAVADQFDAKFGRVLSQDAA